VETQKDGTPFNPHIVCEVPKCPERSCVRVSELPEFATKRKPMRRDLCAGHGLQTIRVYGDKIEVLAVWNGEDLEDWND
jgi:hypothetical protein